MWTQSSCYLTKTKLWEEETDELHLGNSSTAQLILTGFSGYKETVLYYPSLQLITHLSMSFSSINLPFLFLPCGDSVSVWLVFILLFFMNGTSSANWFTSFSHFSSFSPVCVFFFLQIVLLFFPISLFVSLVLNITLLHFFFFFLLCNQKHVDTKVFLFLA